MLPSKVMPYLLRLASPLTDSSIVRKLLQYQGKPTFNVIGIFWRNEEFLIKHTRYTGSLRDSHEEWMGWELEAKQWWSMGWMRVFYDWRQISFALKTFADFSNASVAAQYTVRKTADALLTYKVPHGPSFFSKNTHFLHMLLISNISSEIRTFFFHMKYVFSFTSALNCD